MSAELFLYLLLQDQHTWLDKNRWSNIKIYGQVDHQPVYSVAKKKLRNGMSLGEGISSKWKMSDFRGSHGVSTSFTSVTSQALLHVWCPFPYLFAKSPFRISLLLKFLSNSAAREKNTQCMVLRKRTRRIPSRWTPILLQTWFCWFWEDIQRDGVIQEYRFSGIVARLMHLFYKVNASSPNQYISFYPCSNSLLFVPRVKKYPTYNDGKTGNKILQSLKTRARPKWEKIDWMGCSSH